MVRNGRSEKVHRSAFSACSDALSFLDYPKLLLLLLGLLAPIPAIADCMPYIGEHMRFKVSWEFIDAGYATMNVRPTKNGWHIHSDARTNKFLDLFKKVRDTIDAEGVCVGDRMQSTLFSVRQRERSYRNEKKIEFLWQKNKAIFTRKGESKTYDVPAGHLSVLDAFFATRKLNLKPGQVVTLPVFDSRKRYKVVVRMLPKTETVQAPWGEYVQCIVLEPKLKTEGIFSSKGDIKIWLTNDERHIPLKITAKIKIGSIIARLKEYSRKTPTTR